MKFPRIIPGYSAQQKAACERAVANYTNENPGDVGEQTKALLGLGFRAIELAAVSKITPRTVKKVAFEDATIPIDSEHRLVGLYAVSKVVVAPGIYENSDIRWWFRTGNVLLSAYSSPLELLSCGDTREYDANFPAVHAAAEAAINPNSVLGNFGLVGMDAAERNLENRLGGVHLRLDLPAEE